MADTLINNFHKLPPEFDGELTVKGLHDFNDYFWLSPSGELYWYDDTEAYKWTNAQLVTEEGNPLVKLPTGEHIKLRRKCFSSDFTVFPERGGRSDGWLEARLSIVDGKVRDFIVYKKGARLCRE